MNIRLPGFLRFKKTLPPQHDNQTLLSSLADQIPKDRVRLHITIPAGLFAELYRFLDQKGYVSQKREKEGMSLLLEYGLADIDVNDPVQTDGDGWGPDYAAKCFKCFEYHNENSAITMGLRLHLQQNRALKHKLKAAGLGKYVTQDEWDSWDEEQVNKMYRKYVSGAKS